MLLLILFSLNLIIFLNFKKLSKLVNIYDLPDRKLKLHKKKTPILGGLILLVNYVIYFIYQIFFLEQFLAFKYNDFYIREITSLLFLLLSFFLMGIYDDRYKLNPNKKLFYSIIFILISLFLNKNLIVSMISLSFIDNKIFFENFSIFFTLFCFLILINSLNFYDGINGQSCITFIIIFSFLFFKSDMNYFYLLSICLISFILLLNLKNKLFLGDSGIFLLSLIVSISLVYEYNLNQNILFADEIFFLLLLPGIDLIRLTVSRVFNGNNAFLGDRNHIHHLLIKKFSLTNTNLILSIMFITPVIFFSYIGLNFYTVFIVFLVLYFFLILKLKI